jgi:hypothetical protein
MVEVKGERSGRRERGGIGNVLEKCGEMRKVKEKYLCHLEDPKDEFTILPLT